MPSSERAGGRRDRHTHDGVDADAAWSAAGQDFAKAQAEEVAASSRGKDRYGPERFLIFSDRLV
jgi:hypothetical protein